MITVTTYKKSDGEIALRTHCDRWNFWSWEETQKSLMDPHYHLLTANLSASPSKNWVGSLLYWVGVEHGELLYLFTDPAYRKRGIAKLLFSDMETNLLAIPTCKQLYLEVRISNHAAIALYRSLNLHDVHIRKKYYADGEDAVIFTKEIRSL